MDDLSELSDEDYVALQDAHYRIVALMACNRAAHQCTAHAVHLPLGVLPSRCTMCGAGRLTPSLAALAAQACQSPDNIKPSLEYRYGPGGKKPDQEEAAAAGAPAADE